MSRGLAVHDFFHELGAAAAARTGSAKLGDVVGGASTILNAGPNLTVGNTVAVANDHERRTGP
jgi:hypothetical protein